MGLLSTLTFKKQSLRYFFKYWEFREISGIEDFPDFRAFSRNFDKYFSNNGEYLNKSNNERKKMSLYRPVNLK